MVHLPSLLRAGLRLTANRSAAEDLAQETLLRAWRAWEQYTPGTNCRAWLFRIMMNIFNRGWSRQNAAPVTLSLDDCTEPDLPVQHPSPMLYMKAELLTALSTLRDEQRSVLVLAAVEGFRCREIAQILEIPIGTVMSRLSRARQEMQRLLSPKLDSSAGPKVKNQSVGGGRVQ